MLGQFCGIIPGLVTVKINPALMSRMREYLTAEAFDKMVSSLWGIANWAKQYLSKWMFANVYKHGRRAVKWVVKNVGFIRNALPDNVVKAITETWGEKGAKPWTFAQSFENLVDSIENKNLKSFVENLVDSFFESCSESLMVYAAAVDGY